MPPTILPAMQTCTHRSIHSLVPFGALLAFVLCLSACRGEPGRYEQLEGSWRLETSSGASALIHFDPRQNRLEIDGRPGGMRLVEETSDTVRLELTGPDGGRGTTLIQFLEDGSVTMQRDTASEMPPLRLVRLAEGG